MVGGFEGGSGCGDGVERVQATRRAALEMSGPRYLPGEDDLTGYGGAKNGGFADRFPQIVARRGQAYQPDRNRLGAIFGAPNAGRLAMMSFPGRWALTSHHGRRHIAGPTQHQPRPPFMQTTITRCHCTRCLVTRHPRAADLLAQTQSSRSFSPLEPILSLIVPATNMELLPHHEPTS